MSQSLTDIAKQLKDSNKKVQLIYAFNGTGKTRLSREFKDLISPKTEDSNEKARSKVLYYNAFTEDLFYWDNDLNGDTERKLKIQPNSYTTWALQDQGQDQNAIAHFQRYTDDKLTPSFNEAFSEVTFSFQRGNDEPTKHVKISKGEHSNFVWSIFYAVIKEVIAVRNVAEPAERDTDQFDDLEYIFVDDPVSSLDENHLIQLAVDLAALIKSSFYSSTDGSGIKFIITTHSPLFYNVLHNEFHDSKDKKYHKYRLEKLEDGTHQLVTQADDSPFSYHLFLISQLEKAISTGHVHKYHFNFLRNVLEKMATFLGHKKWGDLLPKTPDGKTDPYESRIINISSHSKHAGEEVADLEDDDKRTIKFILEYIIKTHHFGQKGT